MFSLNWTLLRLSYFEKPEAPINGQTDGRDATLNAAPRKAA